MQFPNINPVFFRIERHDLGFHIGPFDHIGPIEFRWYGLMYILGFITVYLLARSEAKRKNLALTKDDIADLVFLMAIGLIIGARLGYILFYNFSLYISQPMQIFKIWEGGMSFHGGLIGAVLAAIYFARKKKIDFFQVVDLCVPAAPIGLGLGRIGNFINGELYGRVTDVPWGVVFPTGGDKPRHPSQLYEAILEGPVLLLILWIVRRYNVPTGVLSWTFIAMYGVFRFFVEFFREPDQQIGYLFGHISMGQLLSLPLLILGVTMIVITCRRAAGAGKAAGNQ